jgi:hypothetical protein
MDGGYASGEHHKGCSGQILTEYHLQIWRSKVDFNRQWYSVQRGKICKVLFRFWHQSPSFIAAHLQMNRQVERPNRLILQGMKARMFRDMEEKGKNWYKEMQLVLWALCTNINLATKDTPFHLVYGADAVLPLEVFLESAQVAQFSEDDQNEARELDSNLLEEKHNKALANVQKYQESLNCYYNKSVVLR